MREAVTEALSAFAGGGSAKDGAAALLGALGYSSERTEDVGGVDAFVALLEERRPLTARRRKLLGAWRSADIVFQVTGEEIGDRPGLFQDFDRGRARSFLFVAADLEDRPWSRTELAEMARAANLGFAMPVVVLFRHGAAVTLAVVHRRAHRREPDRDVLERVTLIKDVRAADPHRAHVDVLADLALPRLIEAHGVRDFDGLHAAWERTLDIEELNRRFYRELFAWFERAAKACRFPDDGAGEGSTERHVIRLITRLLFVWFMKEKGLIPEALFEDGFARAALVDYAPDGTDYYRAVLQNLFFATLNTEVDRRAFSGRNPGGHRDFARYRYRDLLSDPDGFVETLRAVPFVNGGLFDCLDDFEGVGKGGRRIDAFTDNPAQGKGLEVPARLFLDPERGLFPLFRRYKFTVEENTPLDREVALDPELLGRAFENLLATYNPETRETARKATGSYYTPRHIVDYMVGEALAAALAEKARPAGGDAGWWRDRLAYLLDWEDAFDDAAELFDPDEIESLVRAIAGLRVLDPAAGSGAFPMGVLHRLTLALRRLDPDNARWEALQKELAAARAGHAFDTREEAARNAELVEISRIFETYRDSDFGRKLYLIQNGIYGVDVQPVACQIAKLRFFVSLAIEQEPDREAPNLGIKPLPNLETRFVAADALIGIGTARQGVLRSDAVRALEDRLRHVRESYFNAGARETKRRLRDDDAKLRDQLARELAGPDFGRDDARSHRPLGPLRPERARRLVRPGMDVRRDRRLRRDDRQPALRAGGLPRRAPQGRPRGRHGQRRLRNAVGEVGPVRPVHGEELQAAPRWRRVQPDRLGRLRPRQIRAQGARVVPAQRARGAHRLLQPDQDIRCRRTQPFIPVPKGRRREERAAPAPARTGVRGGHDAFHRRAEGPRRAGLLPGRPVPPSARADRPPRRPLLRLQRHGGPRAREDMRPAPSRWRTSCRTGRTNAIPSRSSRASISTAGSRRGTAGSNGATERAPALFSRKTFPELYDVEEKLLSIDMAASDVRPRVALDDRQLHHNHSIWCFVPWRSLHGIRNRSIRKQARYKDERKRDDLPFREDLERGSRRFSIKYLLGVMNSTAARNFLRARRRSNIHLYPDDWKELPVPDVPPAAQRPVVDLVDGILAARRADRNADVTPMERELDEAVHALYGFTDAEIMDGERTP